MKAVRAGQVAELYQRVALATLINTTAVERQLKILNYADSDLSPEVFLQHIGISETQFKALLYGNELYVPSEGLKFIEAHFGASDQRLKQETLPVETKIIAHRSVDRTHTLFFG